MGMSNIRTTAQIEKESTAIAEMRRVESCAFVMTKDTNPSKTRNVTHSMTRGIESMDIEP
jgi:hypothetical protein